MLIGCFSTNLGSSLYPTNYSWLVDVSLWSKLPHQVIWIAMKLCAQYTINSKSGRSDVRYILFMWHWSQCAVTRPLCWVGIHVITSSDSSSFSCILQNRNIIILFDEYFKSKVMVAKKARSPGTGKKCWDTKIFNFLVFVFFKKRCRYCDTRGVITCLQNLANLKRH